MFQTHIAHQLCWGLTCQRTDTVEERHTTHAHGCCHLLKANLSTAHVLHHVLLDVPHQLLVHGVEHGVVCQFSHFVAIIFLLHQGKCIVRFWWNFLEYRFLLNLCIHQVDGVVGIYMVIQRGNG